MGLPESMHYFISGILLGFAAGVSPGPLLALVISETLMHSRKEGFLVSIAPVLTDLPVIAATVYILSRISNSDFFLGIVSLAGAVFIGYLAYKNIMIRDMHMRIHHVKPQSLRKGVITNFLSPHPYLFWMTIGAPTVLKASQVDISSAVSFIAGFYLLLIGSKILIALIVHRSKNFLQSRTYVYIIRTTGIILLLFSVLFLKDGLVMLGLI
jgi:threonine/homoserine/homoserine lactone efflux protein